MDIAKKIEQGNRLIAKLIGVDIDFSETVYKDSKSPLRHIIDNREKSEGLLFNSNYEWIMPVVELINMRDWVTIYSDECKIHSLQVNEFNTINEIREDQPMINSIFPAIVKYAEWYLQKYNKPIVDCI